ncbi:MAG: hypothetical protein M3T56_12550 [Chloroflexota bacterium]|nr:hypothetical protein [Chloroflexota bacterium]
MAVRRNVVGTTLLVIALTACGSAAARIPAATTSHDQVSDVYLTSSDGSAEGPAARFDQATGGSAYTGTASGGPELVP